MTIHMSDDDFLAALESMPLPKYTEASMCGWCGLPWSIDMSRMTVQSKDYWPAVLCSNECGVWFTMTPPVLP